MIQKRKLTINTIELLYSSQFSRSLNVLANRSLNLLSQVAKDAAIDSIPNDCATNSKIWLCTPSVNIPTISILEPNFCDYRIDQKMIPLSRKTLPFDVANPIDPFKLIAGDLTTLTDSIKSLIGTGHPVLERVAKYLFESDTGKKIRPAMVILMSRAVNIHCRETNSVWKSIDEQNHIETQYKRLAEITEMIHTASLLHDDVIDKAELRRHAPTVNKVFGNKLAILAGDFLLARASVLIARLRDFQVLEIMSTVIEHLVKGEVMQMQKSQDGQELTPLEYYLRKSYYKTGSLIANSCKAGVVLGKHSEQLCNLAFAYGKHIGLAFQLVDDVIDFEGKSSGKALLADLKEGVVTSPVLLAQEQFPALRILADRKFTHPGDIELAEELVHKGNGIQLTKDLAKYQAQLACEAIEQLVPSPERDSLMELTRMVVSRSS